MCSHARAETNGFRLGSFEGRRPGLAGGGPRRAARAGNRVRRRTRVVSNLEDWVAFRRAELEGSGRVETVLLFRAGFEVLRAVFVELAHESETYMIVGARALLVLFSDAILV